jgi:uncharacterized membrane protein
MSKKTSRPSNPSRRKDRASAQDELGLERLILFSDAVFAIAITLLALDIRLPAGAEFFGNAEMLRQLLGLWPKYLAYLISFLAIGSFWLGHHRRFRLIRRYDGGLLTFNLLFLMVIAFIPFPTSVLSESGNRTATIFYALTMILGALMLAALWWHASWQNRLTVPGLDVGEVRRQFVPALLTIVLFVLSIGLAFLNENLARLSWLLVVPISHLAQSSP